VNLSELEKEMGLFVLKLTFFTAIVGLFTFALHRKISPSQLFYAVVLFALMLAFWPDLSAPPQMNHFAPSKPALTGFPMEMKSTKGNP
ncbi:MAG TPA: hypothetical protein VK791_02750, partial [bacterium]|nr:hypothetical protein [bacterium]